MSSPNFSIRTIGAAHCSKTIIFTNLKDPSKNELNFLPEDLAERLLRKLKKHLQPLIIAEERAVLTTPTHYKYSIIRFAQCVKTFETARQSKITTLKETAKSTDTLWCYRKNKLVAVLKYMNGDAGTLHNPHAFEGKQVNPSVFPSRNFLSAQKEAFAFDLAQALGLPDTIPPTTLAVHPTKQRLCSIQSAIPEACTLEEFREKGESISQSNFENVILMTRILWETNGHKKSFLVRKVADENWLIKVDSGLSFPRVNTLGVNALIDLPNAHELLSKDYIVKTLSIRTAIIKRIAKKYSLYMDCFEAALERIEFMKKLVKTLPEITHRQFELRLRMYCDPLSEPTTRKMLKIEEDIPITPEQRIDFALGIYSTKEVLELEHIFLNNFASTDTAILNLSDESEESPEYIFPMDEDL